VTGESILACGRRLDPVFRSLTASATEVSQSLEHRSWIDPNWILEQARARVADGGQNGQPLIRMNLTDGPGPLVTTVWVTG
jgi:hypothetical protein